MANHLPVLVYSKELIQNNTRSSFDEDEFEVQPPITTVIKASEIKDRVIEYLGAVIARCWYDKKLLLGLEYEPHRALRNIGILLPEELEIKLERTNKERPKIIIYEWNAERTFKHRVCYLQMIMMAGK